MTRFVDGRLRRPAAHALEGNVPIEPGAGPFPFHGGPAPAEYAARLASVDSAPLRSAAVHISPGNIAFVVAPAARRIRAQAQWPPVTACASGVTPQQSVAASDPSALSKSQPLALPCWAAR